MFQAFLPLKRILLLMVQVRKVVANGVVFLTFGANALVHFSNQRKSSCQWCTLAFGAVTTGDPTLEFG